MEGGNLVAFGSLGLLQPLMQASVADTALGFKDPILKSAGMRPGCESSKNLKRKPEPSRRAPMATRTSHTSRTWFFKNEPIDLGDEVVGDEVVVIKHVSLVKDFILNRFFKFMLHS